MQCAMLVMPGPCCDGQLASSLWAAGLHQRVASQKFDPNIPDTGYRFGCMHCSKHSELATNTELNYGGSMTAANTTR